MPSGRIPTIEKIQIGIEKLREDTYKKALYSGNQKIWASLLKTLYERKQDRLKRVRELHQWTSVIRNGRRGTVWGTGFCAGKDQAGVEGDAYIPDSVCDCLKSKTE